MPTISVDPLSSRIDKLTTIKVSGLKGGQKFRLRLTSMDKHHVPWSSDDVLQAESDGTLNVTLYHRTNNYDPMYLFNGLTPQNEIPAGKALVYAWADDDLSWSGPDELPFELCGYAADDRDLAHAWARVELGRSAGVAAKVIDIRPGKSHPHGESQQHGHGHDSPKMELGLYGKLFEPARGTAKDAAVLIFGGSEGKLSGAIQVAAGLLAADGYPTLALEYFAPPPAPVPWDGFWTELSQIPLEYFKGALDWLSARTEARRMFVSGTSRGSEVALLLGANYRNILGDPPQGAYARLGVIANVPTLSVHAGVTSAGTSTGHSGWTLGGEELQFDDPPKPHNPASEIPVEQIAGPIFLDGGEDDRVWYSGVAVEQILARLRAKGRNPHVDWHLYRRGGHGLGILVAYLPRAFSSVSPPPQPLPSAPPSTFARVGGLLHGLRTRVGTAATSLAGFLGGISSQDNNIIDGDLWPKLRAYLDTHS